MTPFERFGITHLSPSSCNLFCAAPALWVQERLLGKRAAVGAAAHRGSAVEAGVMAGLYGEDEQRAIDIALGEFDKRTALSGGTRKDKERDGIPDMVRIGIETMKPWGKPTSTQQWVEWQPDGLSVPIKGIYDAYYEDTNTVLDLKTTHKMPSEIKASHAYQVGFYLGAFGDNACAGLAYVTPKKGQVMRLENGRRHRDALAVIALTIQNFLSLFETAEEAARVVAPDYDSFYYNDPETRRTAYEVFGM